MVPEILMLVGLVNGANTDASSFKQELSKPIESKYNVDSSLCEQRMSDYMQLQEKISLNCDVNFNVDEANSLLDYLYDTLEGCDEDFRNKHIGHIYCCAEISELNRIGQQLKDNHQLTDDDVQKLTELEPSLLSYCADLENSQLGYLQKTLNNLKNLSTLKRGVEIVAD